MENREAHIGYLQTPEVRKYITDHLHDDPFSLSLTSKPEPWQKMAIEQIASRQKVKDKLPLWYANPELIMPPPISMEQCSSQVTANFKFQQFSGELAIDLTGGAGIDTWFMAKKFSKVIFVEKDEWLCRIAAHNFKVLGLKNIDIVHSSAEDYLDRHNAMADLVFIDPSRRHAQKGRVFALSDCQPDVHLLHDSLTSQARQVIIKLSPMLDVHMALDYLPASVQAQVVAIKNECKELNILLDKSAAKGPATIHCVQLNNDQSNIFSFDYAEEAKAAMILSDPLHYLYEPNAAIMKAGPFKLLCERYQIAKLHANTQLYTSQHLIREFPGTTYVIKEILKPAEAKQKLKNRQFNIKCRNFPLSPEQLAKKYQVKAGGEQFIFAAKTRHSKNEIMICEALN